MFGTKKSDRNQRVLREVYEKFAPQMLTVCRRYVTDTEEARDVMHDGFIKVFNNYKKVKDKKALEGWIKRIMVNTSIDHYNRKKKNRNVSFNEEYEEHAVVELDNEPSFPLQKGSKPNLDFVMEADFTKEEIIASLNSIDESYSIIFKLHIIERYSHKEIAEMLKISTGVSRTRLSRAREMLKQKLHDMSLEKYTIEQEA